jgi:hypothetical protein
MIRYPKNLWVIDDESYRIFHLTHRDGGNYSFEDRREDFSLGINCYTYRRPGYLVYQGQEDVAFNSDRVFRTEKEAKRGLEKFINSELRRLVNFRNSLEGKKSRVVLKFVKEDSEEVEDDGCLFPLLPVREDTYAKS